MRRPWYIERKMYHFGEGIFKKISSYVVEWAIDAKGMRGGGGFPPNLFVVACANIRARKTRPILKNCLSLCVSMLRRFTRLVYFTFSIFAIFFSG